MVLLDQQQLNRIIKRMAIQVIEKSRGHAVDLIGLNERGYAVAQQMYSIIGEDSNNNVKLHKMVVDGDAAPKAPEKLSRELVIVDDVIYSGRTMFKALNALPGLHDYEFVAVASVVDRGHRRLPVAADIVGIDVPTKVNEHVDFQLIDDKPHKVILTKSNS
jgi:pyrimidine operon attenuation protein/uracil phosphoribosyltransferase